MFGPAAGCVAYALLVALVVVLAPAGKARQETPGVGRECE
jgi:hypothetical protein